MTEITRVAREVQFVKDTLKKVYNPLVAKWFRTTANLGEIRTDFKRACTVDDDDDSAILIILRLFLFYFVVGYFKAGLANFYGSKFDKETDATLHPQLFIYFSQDAGAVADGLSKIDKEKSLRLTKINQAVTVQQLLELAKEVKQQFVENGKGWTYDTGKIAVSYLDEQHGFYRGNYVLVRDKQDGIDLYKKMCNVIDAPFKESQITISNPEKSNLSTSPHTVIIAGKKHKEKRYRPVGRVRFRYAYISFGSIIPPYFLVDLTGRNFTVREN